MKNAKHFGRRAFAMAVVFTLLATEDILGQIAPVQHKTFATRVESGPRSNDASTAATVFFEVIDLSNAPWIRVLFNSAQLEGGSYLRISSRLDGETQILDREALAQWQNSSAYFNGPSVTIELVAAAGTRNNSFSVHEVLGGESISGAEGILRVCSDADTRVASADPRTGRLLTAGLGGGCTGFIIDRGPIGNPGDRCMLSAGHCFVAGSRPFQASTIMQFGVPATLTNCNLQHPPVAQQFPIDTASVVAMNNGPGDDWAVFRTFRNPTTGLTAFQQQGQAFPLAAAVVAGPVTKFGYGVDGDPIEADGDDIHCNCRNGDAQAPNSQTQQTSAGNITGIAGNRVDHSIHTCGGDSGSPVINAAGEIVAIHETGGCDDETPDNAATAITHPNVQAAILAVCNITVPVITIPGDVQFGDTCLGTTNRSTLLVCNTGATNLVVGAITSSNPRFAVVPPSSGFPVVISPDFCFPFRVTFSPVAAGDQSATFSIPSNDPTIPTNTVQAFGRGVRPTVTVFMANAGNFGEVCVGSFKDLDLTVNNAGGCPLVITDITSSSTHFVVPVVVNFPVVVHPGDSVAIPIRFQPTTLGPKSGTIALESNDPTAPNRLFSVSGQAPPGDVRVTGSPDFGDVCAGSLAEKTISVCNVGKCNLSVVSVAFNPPCADFTLINNPFPAIVSPDSCMDVVVRYTPTSCGDHTCTLVIQTDDPDTPVISLTVTASAPCASIDVPPDMAFPPTVISSFGPCRSLLPFPISNTGTCPLWITDIQIGGPQAAEYSFVGLPSFPIILEQGHIVGEGDLSIAFSPDVLARERHATVTVTYMIDPVTGTTASVTRELCGEGVHTGARVLVMQGNIPLAKVEKIQLQRINANRNKDPLDTHDNIQDAPLVTVVPGLPCEPFQYHREYGTVSNPIQLLPGSYQVTVAAIINGKRKNKSVGFDVQTCTFNPTVIIKY